MDPLDNPVAAHASPADLEAQVLSLARQVATIADPTRAAAAQAQLQRAFDPWRASVAALVHRGNLNAPAVKSFVTKIQSAALIQANLPETTAGLHGAGYRDAALRTIANVGVTEAGAAADAVLASNPLLGVAWLAAPPSIVDVLSRGIATIRATIGDDKNGKTSGEARSDVFLVFCPGVARTGTEFVEQERQALSLGVASVRAETGQFHDPDQNADVIAAAVRAGKAMLANPAAKAILVGYSQGGTNVFAFIRDAQARYGDLRRDVIAIHDMHSAARGSQLADLAFALGEYLTTDGDLPPAAQHLLDAYNAGKAMALGLAPGTTKDFAASLKALRDVLIDLRKALRAFDNSLGPALEALGLKGLSYQDLGKRLMGYLSSQQDWVADVAKQGLQGKIASEVLHPLWQRAASTQVGELFKDGVLGPLLDMYVAGRLRSLTTAYCKELISDPRLSQQLAGILTLNSVGAVPSSRKKDLVPPSQRLGYAFFEQLGLASDYQVAVDNQRIETVLPNVIDLPVEGIGHWGVAGVIIPEDHPESYFKDFSPPGLTRSILTTLAALGLL